MALKSACTPQTSLFSSKETEIRGTRRLPRAARPTHQDVGHLATGRNALQALAELRVMVQLRQLPRAVLVHPEHSHETSSGLNLPRNKQLEPQEPQEDVKRGHFKPFHWRRRPKISFADSETFPT